MSRDGTHEAYISDSWKQDADCVIFDCDGVLVDVRESYDRTIQRTARHVLQEYAGISEPADVTEGTIAGFKSTGGFNDEVDLAYASVLCVAAAAQTGSDPEEFTRDVIRHANHTGITSVEQYIGTITDISHIRARLRYPARHGDSPVYDTFDQLFYGPELFHEMFGRRSAFTSPGLIESDVVLLDDRILSDLEDAFHGRMAIVTGRGRRSVQYSLGGMLDRFDIKNSFFLEDEPRAMAKPNPEPLIRSAAAMRSEHCLYVGDSFEDLLMSRGAGSAGVRTSFCGITGASWDPQERTRLFTDGGAALVLDSVRTLAKILNPRTE